MSQALTIGKLARTSGVTPDAIRYYERRGLVPRPVRAPNGYRQYPESMVRRLALIRNAQRLGFSLVEIAGFLKVRESGGRPCEQVHAAGRRMLVALEAQIDELTRARERLRETLRTWDVRLADTPAQRQALLLERLELAPGREPRPRTLARRSR